MKNLLQCDVCALSYPPESVRACPHPAVRSRYGADGVALVCVYECQKCRYRTAEPHTSILGCSYGGGANGKQTAAGGR